MSRTFMVPIVLPADPITALQAATKQYVDAHTHAPGAWQSAAGLYGSGWGASGTAGDQAPRFRLVGDNVQLDGVAARTSGTNTTIFTLPSGYRPTALKRYHTPSGTPSAFTRIAVDTAGVVAQTAGTDFTRTALEGCTFPIT